MQDRSHPATTREPEQLLLTVVLTCTTCDQTYEPTAEAVARGLGCCPYPGCGGWVFSSALTVPEQRTGCGDE